MLDKPFVFTLKLRVVRAALTTIVLSIYVPIEKKLLGLFFSLEFIAILGLAFPLANIISYYFRKLSPIFNYYSTLVVGILFAPCSIIFYFDLITPEYYVITMTLITILILLFGTNFNIELDVRISKHYVEETYKKFLRNRMVTTNITIILITIFLITIQAITDDFKNLLIILILFDISISIFDFYFRKQVLEVFN